LCLAIVLVIRFSWKSHAKLQVPALKVDDTADEKQESELDIMRSQKKDMTTGNETQVETILSQTIAEEEEESREAELAMAKVRKEQGWVFFCHGC
jgi:hypothetical protein